jgi:hypothetical protein
MNTTAKATYYPRRLILAAALGGGLLLALAVHMIVQQLGLDMGGLWRTGGAGPRATSALAWWLIAGVGFVGGYVTTHLMASAASGKISRPMRQFLIAVAVLLLAAAGQAASAPSKIPTLAGVLTGLAAIVLGTLMAFCGAHFALRKS